LSLSFKYYKTTPFLILILVLVGIHSYVSSIITNLPIWIPPISIISFILFVILIYDKIVWKIFPYFLKIKDVSGRYEGTLHSSYKGGKEIHIIIEISQSSSHIYLRQFSYNNESISSSESVNEDMKLKGDGSLEISFAYKNDGIENSNTINEHKGFCVLNCSLDGKELKGYYFTNREEPTKGTIETKLIGKKLKGTY